MALPSEIGGFQGFHGRGIEHEEGTSDTTFLELNVKHITGVHIG